MSDPFGTERLRAATLSAWVSSPTRLREDAATESDLVRGGYRDRLLTELAQNAADAALRLGNGPGHLRVWVSGRQLHVANTGAPLDIGGVHALTALRVSDKTAGVGRFGVGFTAVRAVADEIEFRSTAGGVKFSAEATRRAVVDAGLDVPADEVPVLRLAWPVEELPADGFGSEIVLTLRDDDGASLTNGMRAEAVELLLELLSLESIDIAGTRVERRVVDLGDGLESVTVDHREWWQSRLPAARWLVPVVEGSPTPSGPDVLRAPTRSDEELSLPALIVANVPMQPDRRRVLPGTDVAPLADGYGEFLAMLPTASRALFVPVPGFARSEVDDVLRRRIVREASATPWLPGASGEDLIPSRALLVPGSADELAVLLGDVFDNVVDASVSGPRYAAALAAVGVHRIGLAELADMLTGVDREPAWWGRLYDALAPLVADGNQTEELAALPVPLADGRMVTGPRTTVLGEGMDVLRSGVADGLRWARVVHPDAARPLLSRLGAADATPTDLLTDPALEALLDDLDWDDSDAVDDLTDAVLALAADTRSLPSGLGSLPSWLGSLPLGDAEGELRAADELLLPDAPLARILTADSPFGTVAKSVVDRYGASALRAIGVGWGFGVVTDDLPTGPDHDLDDEEDWWASRTDDPAELLAVRDLDLVNDGAWPNAISELASDPATHAAIRSADGYTAWWLRTHAVIDGEPLGSFRAPSDETFAGLLDAFDHPHADDVAPALAPASCDSAWFAQLVLDRLADPARTPTPAVVARAHRLLAEGVASGQFDVDDLDPPRRVRAIAGDVVDPEDAVVVDRPWFAGVVPTETAVIASMAKASTLASILDVRTASESIDSDVVGVGRVSSWDREPGAVTAYAAMDAELPVGQVVVHRELVVRLRGAATGEREVSWWVTGDGTVHCAERWMHCAGSWISARNRFAGR